MSQTEPGMAPPPSEVSNFDNPPDIFHSVNCAVQITCIIVVTPLVWLRIWVRAKLQGTMNTEDWCCLAAWVMFTAYCINTYLMNTYGGGYNQWNVSQFHLEHFRECVYRNVLIYGPTALLIKITLLMISTRVFKPYRTTVFIINTFMALMVVYYATITIIKIRICTPIRGFWDISVQAKCIDVGKLFAADTSLSVFTDFLILLLPLPLIWNLHLPLLRKLKVFALLGAGGLATGMTVVRLVVVLERMGDPDETVSVVLVSILGSGELAIGLICASLPALNAIVSRVISSCHSSAEVKSKVSNTDVELGDSPSWRRSQNGHTVVEWMSVADTKSGDKSKYDLRGRMNRDKTDDGLCDGAQKRNRSRSGAFEESRVSYVSELGSVRGEENFGRGLEVDFGFEGAEKEKKTGEVVIEDDGDFKAGSKPAIAVIK